MIHHNRNYRGFNLSTIVKIIGSKAASNVVEIASHRICILLTYLEGKKASYYGFLLLNKEIRGSIL
jgi:hypothetical protein